MGGATLFDPTMNQDVPWIYVAMIVIAFISWIFNRIQEATAERQRARELRRRREQGNQKSSEPTPPPIPGNRQPASTPRDEPEDILKDLFEALGGRPAAPVPSPSKPDRPRPVEKKTESRKIPGSTPAAQTRQVLSAAERAALERVQAREAAQRNPEVAPKVIRRGRSAQPLRKLLKSQIGLRQAVVLKEILDPPVSMRDSR